MVVQPVQTISYEDFISCEGGDKARATGKMRLEGPTYIAKEGDIFVFRFRK
jgi:ribosome-binding ATPase YchF (GTP1/OBG family)